MSDYITGGFILFLFCFIKQKQIKNEKICLAKTLRYC